MKYSKLAEVYEDLEQNAAKLKKTEIIALIMVELHGKFSMPIHSFTGFGEE